MKLLFFGTPQEAVPFLRECVRGHEVLAAISRPDRPAGRGLELRASPVKICAQDLGIEVLQPENPRDVSRALRRLKADLAVVVAYGKILPKEVLDSARLGFLNVHFSLLPKFRGAAPIEWALIRGETRTGATIFWLDEGMDTGPIQAVREAAIGLEDDSGSLKAALIKVGVDALRDALSQIARGEVARSPQTGEPTYAPKLTRKDAWVDFDRPAVELHNRVRGLAGGPRAFIRLLPAESAVALVKTSLPPSPLNPFRKTEEEKSPGTVLSIERNRGILVQCSFGQIWLLEVQPEGKRQIPAADFANGLHLKLGNRLAVLKPDSVHNRLSNG